MDAKTAIAAADIMYQHALAVVQQVGVPAEAIPLVSASVSSRLKDFAVAELVRESLEDGGSGEEAGDDSGR